MQRRWTRNQDWSEEQIFEGKAKEYNIAYRFNKSNVKLAGKKSVLFTIIAVVLTFAIILSVVNIVASLITVFNFEESGEKCSLSARDYYAIEVGTFTSPEVATSQAQVCKQMGGAGYIYNNKDSYSVLTSVYQTYDDALSVLDKVIETYPNSKVLTLNAKQADYVYEISQEDKQVLNETLNIFDDLILKLYNLYSSYDVKELEYNTARLSIIEIKKEFDEKLGVYKKVFENIEDDKIGKLNYSLSMVGDELTKLVDVSLEENAFSVVVKHSTLAIVFIRMGL